MPKVASLRAYALADVESAMDSLRVTDQSLRNDVIRALNRASRDIENLTRRKLLARSSTFTLDGSDSRGLNRNMHSIMLPEWPANTVTDVRFITAGASAVHADLTGVIAEGSGKVTLAYDVFPWGVGNISVTANCGYDATLHPEAVEQLQDACLALTQVYYQDWLNQTGRATSIGVGGSSAQVGVTGIPESIAASLDRFIRVM